jgi:UDP-2,3-diacylglucosamine hydrolase
MTVAEFRAPAQWRAIDFLSDLHLSEGTPRTFDAWAAHLRRTSADAVFMLGDLFEAWVGDDARTSGFELRCAEVLRDAATRRTLAFMVGNRDFLVGAELLGECGVVQLADPTVLVAFDQRLLLSHGDALCLEDTEYQRFRAQVRSPAWQAATLARPLAERRALAQQIRTASRERKAQMAKELWADVDAAAATQWLRDAGSTTLIHGHTHRPRSEPLAPGFTRHVLSDWDLEDDAQPPRAEVLRLTAQGLERRAPDR